MKDGKKTEAFQKGINRRVAYEAVVRDEPQHHVTMGIRLQEVRAILKLSQREMAELLDVSPTTVSNWEGDRQVPSWFFLNIILAATGLSWTTLTHKVAPIPRMVKGRRTALAITTGRSIAKRLTCPGSNQPSNTTICFACGANRKLVPPIRIGDPTTLPIHPARRNKKGLLHEQENYPPSPEPRSV